MNCLNTEQKPSSVFQYCIENITQLPSNANWCTAITRLHCRESSRLISDRLVNYCTIKDIKVKDGSVLAFVFHSVQLLS